MRFHRNCVLVLLVSLLGCTASHVANTPAPPPTPVPTAVRRAYNGTAAVGDFLTISINSTLSTLTYTNLTNGESGTIPYTTQADGSYAMKDPSGNLIAAYEVPNYALVVESMKSGPGRDTPALITAVESGPISMATFENNDYNYMQFRTAFGGLSVGSADVSSTAVETSEYWPYGAITNDGDQPFHESSMALSLFTEDKSGTFLTGTLPDGGGSATLFGTANGFFVVDTGNGSILGLEKASSAAFNARDAGVYSTLYYKKTNVQESQDGVETGTAVFGTARITITSAGVLTMTDPAGATMTTGTLTPVADASYLYGSTGELADPCWGMFTYRVTKPTTQSDIFVSFVDGGVVISWFKAPLPWDGNLSSYNYMYGVGLLPPS